MRLGTLRRLQHHLAFVAPACVLLIGGIHAWFAAFSLNVLADVGVLFYATVTLGIALYRRSNGKEATWVTSHEREDLTESADDLVDPFSLDSLFALVAIAFVGFAAALPILGALAAK
jgi:hypothetical protein